LAYSLLDADMGLVSWFSTHIPSSLIFSETKFLLTTSKGFSIFLNNVVFFLGGGGGGRGGTRPPLVVYHFLQDRV
jgi:hypothetical protein